MICTCSVHCPENYCHEKACCAKIWCDCFCHTGKRTKKQQSLKNLHLIKEIKSLYLDNSEIRKRAIKLIELTPTVNWTRISASFIDSLALEYQYNEDNGIFYDAVYIRNYKAELTKFVINEILSE